MHVEIFSKPFIYVVFDSSPHLPDLVIEHSNHLKVLRLQFWTLISIPFLIILWREDYLGATSPTCIDYVIGAFVIVLFLVLLVCITL